MEFTITLPVSSQELFDRLNQSIIEDVDAFTGKKMCLEEISKGFVYQKDINMNQERPNIATISIIEYQAPFTYTIEYSTVKRKSTVTYLVKEIGDKQIEVCYKEVILVNKKNRHGQYEFVEITQTTRTIPFLKRIQFRSLVKDIQKHRKNKQ